MVDSLQINGAWLLYLVTCFYIIRPIRHILIRTILICIPAILLIDISARNLPSHTITSVFTIAVYWMILIRIIHLTVLSPNKFVTFPPFILKCLWSLCPLVPCQSIEKEWSIIFYLISGIVKFILNCWLRRWLLICEANDSYIRVCMYFLSILSYSYVVDIQTVIVRIITQDKYAYQSLNNFPFLSQSIREFWGRRYNRIIGAVLHESIFQPLEPFISSRSIRALITFSVSGLFHVHIVFIVFKDPSSALSTFLCFFLNGIACGIEAHLPIKLPPLVGWLMTHCILFLTAPMCLGPFAQDKAVFFGIDALSSYADPWISKLPMLKFCPT